MVEYFQPPSCQDVGNFGTLMKRLSMKAFRLCGLGTKFFFFFLIMTFLSRNSEACLSGTVISRSILRKRSIIRGILRDMVLWGI